MADAEALLVAVGVIIGGAFLAALGFRRFRLPEVLFLMVLGVVLGPLLHFVDVEGFRNLSPLIGTIAIILILFDGGLEIQMRDLRTGVAKGALLAVLVFSATALLGAAVGHFVAGLPVLHALLLGMAFGGAGAVIVMPMIRQLGVEHNTVTVVSIEAAVSDVLVIVGVYGLATAIKFQLTAPGEFARELFLVFSIGIVAGTAAGFLWSRILSSRLVHGYEYVLTLAALFLLHAVTEHLDGSGPMAVLAFGLVIGNSKKTEAFVEASTRRPKRSTGEARPLAVPVFTETLAGFHHEVVFLIRSFFFVGLGVVLDLEVLKQPRFLLVGLLLTAAVIAGRFWGTAIVFWRSKVARVDQFAVGAMFPLGLAAAALSQVPFQVFEFPEAKDFGSYAAVVILLTNVFCSIAVWMMGRPWMQAMMAPPPPQRASRSATVAPVSVRRRP